MTHNEFKKELKSMLVKQVENQVCFCRSSFEAFENGELSTEETKNNFEVMRFQKLKGEIINLILQTTPSNDHSMSSNELWNILEYVERHKRIAKKYMPKVDAFYSELGKFVDSK